MPIFIHSVNLFNMSAASCSLSRYFVSPFNRWTPVSCSLGCSGAEITNCSGWNLACPGTKWARINEPINLQLNHALLFFLGHLLHPNSWRRERFSFPPNSLLNSQWSRQEIPTRNEKGLHVIRASLYVYVYIYANLLFRTFSAWKDRGDITLNTHGR